MNTIRTTLTLAVCAGALAVTAGTASAGDIKIPKDIKPAVHFKATLTGSQVTTWDYNKPNDPNDPCDVSATGHGDQQLSFQGPKNLKITAVQAPKSTPNFWNTNGRPQVLTEPVDVRAKIDAERNGEFTTHPEDIDQNVCSGDNGGGAPTGDQIPRDCGKRTGGAYLEPVFFTDGEVDGLYVPLPGGQPADTNHLTLSSSLYNWADPVRGGYTGTLDGTFVHCPFELEDARADRDGLLYASSAKLKEKDLFNPRKKKLVASGSVIVNLKGGKYSSGKTIIAWNLRLTRTR
jgi:hypothetical protein